MKRAWLSMVLALGASQALAHAQPDPRTMPPDTWLSVPDSHMRQVAPTEGEFEGIWGGLGPAGVIAAWGGGVLDTRRSRLVVWGGGHGDYYGNELYAFDIGALRWERITDPTASLTFDSDVNWDGTPPSRHTYGGMAYIAHADRFFASAGGLSSINGIWSSDRTWTFDFDALAWTDRSPTPSAPNGGFGCNCSYDPETRKVWWGSCASSFDGLWDYDYDDNAWTRHNDDNFYYYASTIDTLRGRMVVVGNGEVFVYDVRGGSYVKETWETTGAESLVAQANLGLDYDPELDRIVGWRGGSPYLLDPETRTWTRGSDVGAPPEGVNGIYGRWRYAPSVNAFIVVTGIDEDVYFYKASEGEGMPPEPVGDGGTPPGNDAGTAPPSDASTGADGGSVEIDGGCSCSVGGGPRARGAGIAGALLLLGAGARRRRVRRAEGTR